MNHLLLTRTLQNFKTRQLEEISWRNPVRGKHKLWTRPTFKNHMALCRLLHQ